MKTDAQIQQYVLTELCWDPAVTPANIGVQVTDGIVTLTGHVASHEGKLAAEHAAQQVAGVRGLAVQLDIGSPGSSRRDDADIALSAGNVLRWAANVPADAVRVTVEGGWITLSGEVDWEYQRQAAMNAVHSLNGVSGVSNRVSLRPRSVPGKIKSQIEAALARRVLSDVKEIKVSVQGTGITLSGTVDSWSERELASQCAWGAPGVRSVTNNLGIAW